MEKYKEYKVMPFGDAKNYNTSEGVEIDPEFIKNFYNARKKQNKKFRSKKKETMNKSFE